MAERRISAQDRAQFNQRPIRKPNYQPTDDYQVKKPPRISDGPKSGGSKGQVRNPSTLPPRTHGDKPVSFFGKGKKSKFF